MAAELEALEGEIEDLREIGKAVNHDNNEVEEEEKNADQLENFEEVANIQRVLEASSESAREKLLAVLE